MTRFPTRLASAGLAAALLLGASSQAALAQSTGPAPVLNVGSSEYAISRKLDLSIGRSLVVELPRDAKEVFVANPKVANAVVRTARKLFVIGIADGATSMFVMDGEGRQITALEINVGRDLNVLRQTLRTALPNSQIEIKPAPAAASLDFVAVASPLANPGPDSVPAPVVMRLYQLNAETNFSNASFRQLWEEDAKTLGPTMLGKTEIYLTPGGIEHVKANLIEGTSIVAVVVGFRNFENAKWRAMVGLQGEKRFKLKADLKTLAVDLGPQD